LPMKAWGRHCHLAFNAAFMFPTSGPIASAGGKSSNLDVEGKTGLCSIPARSAAQELDRKPDGKSL